MAILHGPAFFHWLSCAQVNSHLERSGMSLHDEVGLTLKNTLCIPVSVTRAVFKITK